MGNRAIITTERKNLGVYLHWNGGKDSVEPFLEYCQMQDFRGALSDEPYAFARLVQVISNFMGGSTGVGIQTCIDSPGDNGIYIINDNWEIIGREDAPYFEYDEYNRLDFLVYLDSRQPEYMQLGREWIEREYINPAFLNPGDTVLIRDYNGTQEVTIQGMWTQEQADVYGYSEDIGHPYAFIQESNPLISRDTRPYILTGSKQCKLKKRLERK